MRVETYRFGTLEVDPETNLVMPEGLIGMGDITRLCLIEEGPEKPVRWLQVVGQPALAFAVIDPYDFYADYECELSDEDAAFLGAEAPEDVVVLALLTISPDGREVTANLVAPVVACPRTRRARQIILSSDSYTTRHPLVYRERAAVAVPA